MQLDDGEADRKPCVSLLVPSVQSRTISPICRVQRVCFFSDPHSLGCAEHDGDDHTVAVSYQCSSRVLEDDCVRGLWNQKCAVSSVPVTWCGLFLGLCGSPSLDGAHTECSSDEDGIQAGRAWTPMTIAGREHFPEICNATPHGVLS